MPITSILRQLTEFDSALLANTIGRIDPTPAEEIYMGGTIQCQTPGIGAMAGIAVTCEIDSSSPGGKNEMSLYYEQLEQIEKIEEPVVWVVKAIGSRPDHECVLGDGMANALHSVGCIGAVTNGGVRDLDGVAAVPFHAFARCPVIHHGALRLLKINGPVEVGGMTIRSGEVIHGSKEGVIRIPKSCLGRLPEWAAKLREYENEAVATIHRRADIPPRLKPEMARALRARYGFVN